MQHTITLLIVALCAFFVGRRLYRSLGKSARSGGCGCSCSGCSTDLSTICHPDRKSDPSS